MRTLVALFKALGDESRMRIMRLLHERELCVCELVEVLGVSSSAVSQHLRRLKAVGLVEERREAQWVYYSAPPDALGRVADRLRVLGESPLADIAGMEAEATNYLHLSREPKFSRCGPRCADGARDAARARLADGVGGQKEGVRE